MTLFLSSFILGIAFCAPPGIVTAETVRRGLARGFWPALLVQLGSLIGDTTWATIALTGAAFLIQNWLARLILTTLGIGLLLRLAWVALKNARRATPLSEIPVSEHGDLATGALLSLSNPFAIAFWAGVGASVFAGIPGGPRWSDFAIFFSAFLSGAFLWCFFIAGLVAWGRKFVTPIFFRWVNLTCGLTLTFFSVQLGWQLVQNWP
jgi:chemosensory pili system protein ChpE